MHAHSMNMIVHDIEEEMKKIRQNYSRKGESKDDGRVNHARVLGGRRRGNNTADELEHLRSTQWP